MLQQNSKDGSLRWERDLSAGRWERSNSNDHPFPERSKEIRYRERRNSGEERNQRKLVERSSLTVAQIVDLRETEAKW